MSGIGNAVWVQSADESDPSIEITVPVVLPPGVRTKELTISVKDGAVLCIKHKETSLVQWRLYAAVSADVEWRAEQDNVVVDLQKVDATSWPCLLNLPIRPDDRLIATEAELDAMFASEVKPLPPLPESKAKPVDGEATVDEDDLERLLEETVQEVQELDMYVKAELKGMEEEELEMTSKLRELEESLVTVDTDEARETASKQIKLLEKMLDVHSQTRRLRSQDCTLKLFLETQMLDLHKSRINVGELSESESEAFADDDERSLTPHQLLQIGVKHLQEQNLEAAIHYLRLAAVHHKHPQSTSILFRIYSELGSPRGAYLLLTRAKDDDDMDITTNLQVAEMFDRGARHFPPIFGAAIHFYQRAARCGSVHAMIGLAQLYLRGSTAATTLNETERAANVNMTKYHGWLQQAMDRGSGAAYFIKGCMHLRGEHGCEKSYKKAKEYIDRANKCNSDIAKRAVSVGAALDKLRIEELAAFGGDSPASPVQPATPLNSPAAGAAVAKAPPAPRIDAAARLAALENQGGVTTPLEKKPAAKKPGANHAAASARSRSFWERSATTGAAVFAVWTLAFPLRALLLGHFYNLLQWFLESFGIGGIAPSGGMML